MESASEKQLKKAMKRDNNRLKESETPRLPGEGNCNDHLKIDSSQHRLCNI